MKHRLCRIALPVFLLLALFLALAMLSANTSRRHADAQTTFSSLFGLLWIDGTLAESNPYAFVTQHEETYYVLDDTHSYVFRCQNTEQLANISDYSAAVGGRPYTLIRDENSGLYGFDFGTQSGNFDIQFSYSDHGGATVTETLHVRVVRELGENIWYSANGWEVREDTFTAGRGAGELTILSGGEEQMRRLLRRRDSTASERRKRYHSRRGRRIPRGGIFLRGRRDGDRYARRKQTGSAPCALRRFPRKRARSGRYGDRARYLRPIRLRNTCLPRV